MDSSGVLYRSSRRKQHMDMVRLNLHMQVLPFSRPLFYDDFISHSHRRSHAPESCGCVWDSSYDLLILNPRGCKAMGEDARVALYAPSVLVPYVSLPSTIGGSTGYYSTTVLNGTSTWISTAVSGCKIADLEFILCMHLLDIGRHTCNHHSIHYL